jgi:hypothetical protein
MVFHAIETPAHPRHEHLLRYENRGPTLEVGFGGFRGEVVQSLGDSHLVLVELYIGVMNRVGGFAFAPAPAFIWP